MTRGARRKINALKRQLGVSGRYTELAQQRLEEAEDAFAERHYKRAASICKEGMQALSSPKL